MNALQPLSAEETELKAACIAAVREGMEAFTKVGRALLEIRESRLYRDTHATFEEFCRDEFGLQRRRAYQLIEAAVVVEESPECEKFYTNESQARALAKIEPEKRAEVLQKAAESGKVTAKAIREAASNPDPALPDDEETRDYKRTLKLKSFSDAAMDWLASFKASRRDMVAAALHFKKLAADLEKAAAQMDDSE